MGIFIITEYDDDRSDYSFIPEDDEFGYFTDRDAAEAAIAEKVRIRRTLGYAMNREAIERRNAKIDRSNKEKAAIEAAGLEYQYRCGLDTKAPGPLEPVPTLEEWLAKGGDHDYNVAELKLAGS